MKKTLSIALVVLIGCATANTLKALQLSWSPPTGVAAGYNAYAMPPGATNFTLLASVTSTSLPLTNAVTGTAYYVTAFSSDGLESAPSNIVTNTRPGQVVLKINN